MFLQVAIQRLTHSLAIIQHLLDIGPRQIGRQHFGRHINGINLQRLLQGGVSFLNKVPQHLIGR